MTFREGWWASIRFGLAAVLAYRIATEIVMLVGRSGLPAFTAAAHDPTATLIKPWLQWDANWQVAIARWGYGFAVAGPHHVYSSAAFQPLLPGSMALVSGLTGISLPATGLILVTLALGAAAIGLHRLTALDYGRRAAGLAVILLLLYPTAVFLGAPYAEPVVLAEVVWAFLEVRRGRLLLAGVLLGLGEFTKLFAAVFIVPLVVEAIASSPPPWRQRWKALGSVLIGPVAGLAALALFYAVVFHNPLEVLSAERLWTGRHLAFPWVALWSALHPAPTLTVNDAGAIADLVSVALLVIAAGFAWRRLRRSYAVALIVLLLAFTSTGVLVSTSRWTLDAFPLFIAGAVAAQGRRWVAPAMIAVAAPAMALFIWIYTRGGWAG